MFPARNLLAFLTMSGAAVAQPYVISTVAGGAPPPTPVLAVNASIGQPSTVATDAGGNVYFTSLQCVFKLDASGVLTRVAGNARLGYSGDGGAATSAQLNSPAGVALDGSGNLYIADALNNRIRMVSPGGIITTVAGNGAPGYSGDGGPAIGAQLHNPYGVFVDGSGNLYIADASNNRIRKVSSGGIVTVAGNGNAGYTGDSGSATSATLSYPTGMAVDGSGNIYIADTNNHRIRKVSSSDGNITTVAGNGTAGFSIDGGLATSVSLDYPTGIALDGSGNLFTADLGTNRIRKVSNGLLTSVAGTGVSGFSGDGGPATGAQLANPHSVAVDGSGILYIADTNNNRIRKVSSNGIITVAGNGTAGYSGDDGLAKSAQLTSAAGVAADGLGNLYIADDGDQRIRKVSPAGIIATVAGNGALGFSGDFGQATSASLNQPKGVAVDGSGNLYIADYGNARVRKVSPGGAITTVAGTGVFGFSGDGGQATSAALNQPRGVAVDGSGNLYIADRGNARIRKVSPNGVITTVAGGGASDPGDGGPATSAQLYGPWDVIADGSTPANLYIAEGNHTIRKVFPGGIITTVAGTGSGGFSGDGGPATGAQLYFPVGVAVDASGNIYIADMSNFRLRKVSSGGVINTVAGTGVGGYSGDGGLATNAQLDTPAGVAVDASGNVYIADAGAGAVRLLQPAAALSIVTTSPLPQGSVGAAYSQALSAAGGAPPYSWSATPAALPGGLTLSSGGTISGTPTTVGAFSFAAQVKDSAAAAAGATFALTISQEPVCVGSLNLTSLSFTAAGGTVTVAVTAAAGCSWTASNSLSWVTIASGASGTGNGAVTIQVAANGSTARSGSITIAGQTLSIQQAGIPCTYSVWPAGQAFPTAGGTGAITVTAAPGCSWTASALPSWVAVAGGASGTGNGTVTYQVANNAGAWRSGTLSVAGSSFLVEQASGLLGTLSTVGAMPHLSFAGGWQTAIMLVNLGTSTAQARLNFFDDNGAPMLLPLSFPQAPPLGGPLLAATLERTITPGAVVVVQTSATGTIAASSWAQLQSNGGITAFARFNWTSGGGTQEAVVPLESRTPASSFVLWYDHTDGFVTGMALSNMTAADASIVVTVRDDAGNVIAADNLPLSAYGHKSFLVGDQYPAAASKRGTIEFRVPPGGQIATLAFRAALGTLSTIPSMAK